MKKILIIITGCPGSGKTSLAQQICEHFPYLKMISYDTIKETYFDRYGFDDMESKERLNEQSLKMFYHILDSEMKDGKALLIEYPFCRKHAEMLEKLAEKHSCPILTILLKGDMKTLYLRSICRDGSNERHLGHLLTKYHKGQKPQAEDWILPMRFSDYVKMCREKDYDIRLGSTIDVDVTDVDTVDIDNICSHIKDAVLL